MPDKGPTEASQFHLLSSQDSVVASVASARWLWWRIGSDLSCLFQHFDGTFNHLLMYTAVYSQLLSSHTHFHKHIPSSAFMGGKECHLSNVIDNCCTATSKCGQILWGKLFIWVNIKISTRNILKFHLEFFIGLAILGMAILVPKSI